jgi:DNA topoisomerase-1
MATAMPGTTLASGVPMPAEAAPADVAPPGLRWVSDNEPGLTRRRRGDAFEFVDDQGRVVRDEATLARIRKLAIPPAYEQVWICADANGHLQATARDARGRKQYRYHPDWIAARGATKFDRAREFGLLLPRLRERVSRCLAASDEPTRETVLATLVRLLDTTWLRIGNDEYARLNGSYGLSTLRTRHAGVRGAELKLSFVGKSGVRHEVRLSDRRVAGVVRRCRDLPGQALFQYVDDDGCVRRVGSADVNEWLAHCCGGAGITAKDFRTWHGSVQALDLIVAALQRDDGAMPPLPALVAEVARRLGNTPAVCRKAYIHPVVLELGECVAKDAKARAALRRQRWLTTPPAQRGLSLAERRLLGLLRASAARPRAAKRSTTAPSPWRRSPEAASALRR